MYSAFVKELVGRMPAISSLEALSAQLAQMGCPASRLAQQAYISPYLPYISRLAPRAAGRAHR